MSEPVANEALRDAGLTRRQALKTGALVAGSAVWATPLIQAVTVAQASADHPSGGGKDKVKEKDK